MYGFAIYQHTMFQLRSSMGQMPALAEGGNSANDDPNAMKPMAMKPRVARWYIFKPKIPVWVNFGGSCNGDDGIPILCPFGILFGHLV
jgi:hypothetical protein